MRCLGIARADDLVEHAHFDKARGITKRLSERLVRPTGCWIPQSDGYATESPLRHCIAVLP